MTLKEQWHAAFQVIERLEANGYEAVVVGGAVRDYLRSVPAHDVDVATSALPLEVKALFDRTIDIGIEHGTVLVLQGDEAIEVTTYRADGEYVDHRRPDGVAFVTSLAEDLKRRDFTMNAMAIRANEEVVDLYGGKQDLQHKVIRSVGNAVERFTEDALRMLRAVRFSAQLCFTIEAKTKEAIQLKAADIQFVAIERVKAEFDKIFTSVQPMAAFENLQATSLGNYLPGDFSKAAAWGKFEQATEANVGWAYFAWQNDCSILTNYRCSNKEKLFVKQVHQVLEALQNAKFTRWTMFTYNEAVLRAAFLCAQYEKITVPQSIGETLVQKAQLPIQDVQQIVVNGRMFIAWSGKRGGPWLKEVLQHLAEQIVYGKVPNEVQAIKEWFMREWNNQI